MHPRSIAIDTETTGLDLHGPDMPFVITTCDDEGNQWICQWDVDPFTRKPRILKRDLKQFRQLIRKHELVFHNAKFDILALEKINFDFHWRGHSHDTGISSHIVNSVTHRRYNGKLKPLAYHYLDYSDDDEKELRKAVSSARQRAKRQKLGWNLSIDDDSLAADYWVLRAFCKLVPDFLPENEHWELGDDPVDHPWYSLVEKYALADAERTVMLHMVFKDDVEANHLEMYQRECRLIETLYDMGQCGVTVHPKSIKSEIKRYTKIIDPAVSAMVDIVGENFNPNSPQQLGNILYNEFGFRADFKTATGNDSTDKNAITSIRQQLETRKNKKQHKFVNALVKYTGAKSAAAYLNSYMGFLHGDRLFPSINQTGTGTTRVSSSNPNGQNVGKGKDLEDHEKPEYNLRTVFGPRPGRVWYCMDYSQLQLRIFAYLAGEKDLIQAFKDGYDAHTYMAMRIYNKTADQITKLERRIAKNVNFGFIFGAQPARIDLTAGITGLWETVINMFPHAHEYMSATKRRVIKDGYITTPHGYKLYLPFKYGRIAAHAGVNYEVQGCEGDIVKQAMINCDNFLMAEQERGHDFSMIYQVHDELIFDADNRCFLSNESILKTLKQLMEQPGIDVGMITPVDVEYTTTNWSDTEKLELWHDK